jgi:putative NADH-flavin reductase
MLGYLADRVLQPGPSSGTVAQVLNRPALTFAEWAAKHAAAFQTKQEACSLAAGRDRALNADNTPATRESSGSTKVEKGRTTVRLFVLGATGRTGAELVDQALARGHAVTAFVRSPRKIPRAHERLTVIEGDPRDAVQLRAALPGHDVVLSALGPGPAADHPRLPLPFTNGSGPVTVCGDSAQSTVRAMRETGLRRLLVVSVSFLFSDFLLGKIVGNLLFRDVVRDAREMERVVAASGMDWTIVRPPQLTNGVRTKRYRVMDGHLPPRGFSLSREDLAHFMLQEVEDPHHLRSIVGVSR